jgi:hypothetical protein
MMGLFFWSLVIFVARMPLMRMLMLMLMGPLVVSRVRVSGWLAGFSFSFLPLPVLSEMVALFLRGAGVVLPRSSAAL